MRLNQIVSTAIVAALSGTALGGQSNTVGDTAAFMAAFAPHSNGNPYALNWHTTLSAGIPVTPGHNGSFVTNGPENFTFDSLASALPPGTNGGFNVNISATDSGSFYFGDTDNLRNVDFNAGNDPRPTHNSLAVAFGNNLWTSNELIMDFSPGVTAFGFNYEDIGDVGGTLEVLFSDSTFERITTAGNSSDPDRDGFMWSVAAANTTIDRITFTQTFPGNDPDDGFIFYDFVSIQTIPLPPAALAGLGLLGGLGVARRLRKH